MDAVNPYRLWQAEVYANVSGFNNHAYQCFDCIGYLHYANKYNILIASMGTDSVANTVVTSDGRIASDANSGKDCDVLLSDIWNNLCVKGVHVVVRYVDLWIDDDFDTRTSFTVGEKKSITVWAEEGSCDKTQQKNFRSSILATPDVFLN
jgi:hypothetical protein